MAMHANKSMSRLLLSISVVYLFDLIFIFFACIYPSSQYHFANTTPHVTLLFFCYTGKNWELIGAVKEHLSIWERSAKKIMVCSLIGNIHWPNLFAAFGPPDLARWRRPNIDWSSDSQIGPARAPRMLQSSLAIEILQNSIKPATRAKYRSG